MRKTIRIGSVQFTIDLVEENDGLWTASMMFRGELLEARSATSAEAMAALMVALKSEIIG